MPRKLRVQYPGAIYHVMSRGDQREDIFFDDVDRHDCIKTLAEACLKTDWQVHAFCSLRAPLKRALAAKLRREASLSFKQISERLGLGEPKGARSNLHKWMNRHPEDDSPPNVSI